MRIKEPKLGKATPLELVFLYGAPVLFLALAWYLATSFLGPPLQVSTVRQIKDGAVKTGMSEVQVLRAVGEPKGRIEKTEGAFTYRFQSSAWDPDRKVPLEEDAYIEFDANGYVTSLSFDSRVPPTPSDAKP
jgi:hypothetical protein